MAEQSNPDLGPVGIHAIDGSDVIGPTGRRAIPQARLLVDILDRCIDSDPVDIEHRVAIEFNAHTLEGAKTEFTSLGLGCELDQGLGPGSLQEKPSEVREDPRGRSTLQMSGHDCGLADRLSFLQ